MLNHSYKQHKDFFMLGMDFNENGFRGLLGDYIQSSAKKGIDFTVNIHQETGAKEQLVYLKAFPAILKQIPELVYGYFNQFSAVIACEYERDKQFIYTLTVTSWEEFIDQFGRTQNDKADLIPVLKRAKKSYGLS